MRKIRTLALAATFLVSLTLCSCSSVFTAGGENLIGPPVLVKEQQEITRALKSSVGDKITLVYPSSGENRSAFLFADMDGDSENEAVAFYRPSADDLIKDVVHVNILKKQNSSRWNSVCDIVGEATGIDKVSTGVFSKKTELIIGWDLMREKEKTLVCYSLYGKTPSRDFTANYVQFAVKDFYAESAGDELITVNFSQTTDTLTQSTQHARLIAVREGEFSVISSVPLDSRVTGYNNCVAGKYNETANAFFLDGIIDAANVNTQILTVDSEGNLKNPLLDESFTDPGNVHKTSLLTQDFDGDGIYEVPSQQAVTGYDVVPESERIYKTVWKHLKNGRLKKSAVMYISPFGIRITIPRQLDERVTIKTVTAQNEIKFYEYKNSIENSTHELFSVRVSEADLYEKQEGYDILKSNDFTIVTVNITDMESDLCPTWKELFDMVEII